MRGWGVGLGVVVGVAFVCCGGAVERSSSSSTSVADASVAPPPPPLPPALSTCAPWDGKPIADCSPVASIEQTSLGGVTATLPATLANDCTDQLRLSKTMGTGTICAARHLRFANDVWVVQGTRLIKGVLDPDGFRIACLDGLPFGQDHAVTVHFTRCDGIDDRAEYTVRFESVDGGGADSFTIRYTGPTSGDGR